MNHCFIKINILFITHLCFELKILRQQPCAQKSRHQKENVSYLGKLANHGASIFGVQLKELVDVLGGLNLPEDLEVPQRELPGHLGGVELQQRDLTLLQQLADHLVRDEGVRAVVVLQVVSMHTRQSAPDTPADCGVGVAVQSAGSRPCSTHIAGGRKEERGKSWVSI